MSIYFAMSLYALSMSLSPGPVNLVALSSGINQGLPKSVPFVAGASVGFIILFFLVGVGFGQLASLLPSLMIVLKVSGIVFMLYVSYLLFNASGNVSLSNRYNATFWQGAIMQWLNPKAWMASTAAVSAFELNIFANLVIFCGIYLLICFACILAWAGAGNLLQHLLKQEQRMALFNKAMAIVLSFVAIIVLLI
ncbi:LysE family translocator [Thalassotalea fusca]